jgi:hypothetical protein
MKAHPARAPLSFLELENFMKLMFGLVDDECR